jgi:hypothetical protein
VTRPSGKQWQVRTFLPPGGHLATVASLSPLTVNVPDITTNAPLPASILEGLWSDESTASASGHTHVMGSPLAVGDQVVVLSMAGQSDQVVVLGRLR